MHRAHPNRDTHFGRTLPWLTRGCTAPALMVAVATCWLTATPARAYYDREVGIGVAAGLSYSPTKLQNGQLQRTVGEGFAWGFFVDVPLLETFYISPAAMLYDLDLGDGNKPVTDIDLNFKFLVPLSALRLGVGLTVGLTNAEQKYGGHVGGLGYLSLNLVSNLDVFLMLQYKRLFRDYQDIDDLHGYLGAMFRL